MKKLKSIADAEAALQVYVPNVAKYLGDNMSLDRTTQLMDKVGNPHESIRAIHIAGTSGKTSTAYYCAALLQTSGKQVGLTVSPHVDSITERFQVNGKPMDDALFCRELEVFLGLIKNLNPQPSYFELMIAFVYWETKRLKLNYLVVETGMGGLLDATNVLQQSDKVCVITDIGFDHMHVLGNTLPEITAQKIGIVYERNRVFMFEQSPEIMAVVRNYVNAQSARLSIVKEPEGVEFADPRLPDFQIHNFWLASNVVKFVARRDNLKIIEKSALGTVIPGRMEIRKLEDGSTIIMDGAHNEQKTKAFVESYKKMYPNQKADILLALKQGKEYRDVLQNLKPICARLILTTFDTSQDLPAVSQNPRDLEKVCRELKLDCKIVRKNTEALDNLLTSKGIIKLITGSFYLLAQVRPLLNEHQG